MDRTVLYVGQLAVGAFLLAIGALVVGFDSTLAVIFAFVAAAFGVGLLIRTLRSGYDARLRLREVDVEEGDR